MNAESKGREAERILKDEVFIEAEAIAKAQLMREWESAKDAARREEIWHEIQALGATRKALQVLVSRGTTAAHQAQKESRVQ